ncbi:hypothetical protein NE237_019580 [Protea cynaroides]|uniref:Uncharacterized protein n=1 Tax=Protea cynaroides TaxID=273540 RepID=A0A9Q0H5L3_9MAGN|nr:hypothetical protein NE237_019580 [Protea cynaroides]
MKMTNWTRFLALQFQASNNTICCPRIHHGITTMKLLKPSQLKALNDKTPPSKPFAVCSASEPPYHLDKSIIVIDLSWDSSNSFTCSFHHLQHQCQLSNP